MIAFGITTQSRKEMFFETLQAVYRYAPTHSVIVVNDDGSTDGSKEDIAKWITEIAGTGPKVLLTGSEKIVGVANSKSNLVKEILTFPGITDILLIEDDVLPIKENWYEYFILCAWEHKQAHLLFLPTDYKYGKVQILDDGEYPIQWKPYCSGLVMYFREELLREMKGFENRFGRYGWDHNELTSRCLIAQMANPDLYPHCVKAETEFALLSRDMEAEQKREKLPSSTLDAGPDGQRTKKLLALENKPLYDELMNHYRRAYANVKNTPEAEKLNHRSRYYFKNEST